MAIPRTIADVGRYLREVGLDIGEHPEFGGVGGGHESDGYHPVGMAVDVRDWRPDMAPEYEGGPNLHWKERTARLRDRARQLGVFNEALGPGDQGHDTHLHLALDGKKPISDAQLSYLARGRWQTPEGQWVTDVPGAAAAGATTPAPAAAPAGFDQEDLALRDLEKRMKDNPIQLQNLSLPKPTNQLAMFAQDLSRSTGQAVQAATRMVDPAGTLKILKDLGISIL